MTDNCVFRASYLLPSVDALCVVLSAVVPGYRVDGRRRRDGLFLVLPGGQELADHGILQESHSTGLTSILASFNPGHMSLRQLAGLWQSKVSK